MVKKKACKKCKIFVKGNECPFCSSKDLSGNWKGRITILDKEKSEIAQHLKFTKNGEYALKVR